MTPDLPLLLRWMPHPRPRPVPSSSSAFISGVCFALLTGVLDGTLMTAFSAYKQEQGGEGTTTTPSN